MILNDTLRDFMRGSKAVDKNGNPLRLFHGTNANVALFDGRLSNSKSKTGVPENCFLFTDSHEIASSYTVQWEGDFSRKYHDGANVMPVYLNLQNPMKVSAKGESWNDILYKGESVTTNDLMEIAQSKGRYDGIIISRVRDKGVGSVSNPVATTYVAFDPHQIKSAIGTADFDNRSPFLTSKTPAEQALHNFRFCAIATGRYDCKDPDQREVLRRQEFMVSVNAMTPEDRLQFLCTEIAGAKGWFGHMAKDYVEGLLTNDTQSTYEVFFDDLGDDWTLPGFGHSLEQPTLRDFTAIQQVSNSRWHLKDEGPQNSLRF